MVIIFNIVISIHLIINKIRITSNLVICPQQRLVNTVFLYAVKEISILHPQALEQRSFNGVVTSMQDTNHDMSPSPSDILECKAQQCPDLVKKGTASTYTIVHISVVSDNF